MARLTSVAAMPVARKFGMTVNAPSVPYSQRAWAGPMDSIRGPGVDWLPWRISKKP